MSPAASILVLPLDHQVEAVDRLAGKLDRALLARQSTAAYQDISEELAAMRRLFVDTGSRVGDAAEGVDKYVRAIGQVDRLKAIVDHLFSIAVPASADCVAPQRATEEG